MKILQNSFNQYLNKNYFFEKKPNIAVAVSGGPDSMCLIHLLKNYIYSQMKCIYIRDIEEVRV